MGLLAGYAQLLRSIGWLHVLLSVCVVLSLCRSCQISVAFTFHSPRCRANVLHPRFSANRKYKWQHWKYGQIVCSPINCQMISPKRVLLVMNLMRTLSKCIHHQNNKHVNWFLCSTWNPLSFFLYIKKAVPNEERKRPRIIYIHIMNSYIILFYRWWTVVCIIFDAVPCHSRDNSVRV